MTIADLPIAVQVIIEYLNKLLGSGSRLWPGYMLAFIFIAFAVYKHEGRKEGFWRFAFPKEFYRSDSVKTDLKLFLFNAILRIIDVFNAVGVKAFVALSIIGALYSAGIISGQTPRMDVHPLIVALILFFVADFFAYFFHRIHHTTEPLWVFHAVHHSSEFLTPISNYRSHPLYGVLSRFFLAVFGGIIDGILIAFLFNSMDAATLVGINALGFIFNATGSNLRHSHIWLSYGPFLSYIFISPAMHQIHHSRNPKHYNKNFGTAFSVFDWLFGTLYIPKEREHLEFGLCDAHGNAIQPHDGLVNAIFVPFKHLGQWWRGRKSENPNELQRANHNM